MKGKCKNCPNHIPDSRKSNDYCSDECAYAAKKKRNRERYHNNKSLMDKIKNSEKILEKLFSLIALKKEWNYDDLVKLNFDFTIATGQLAGKGGEFWTLVNEYAYYINPKTKIVSIWKKH